jgi:putative transposase
VVGNVWPQAIVQTCIIHLIRNTFRLASKRDWDALKRAVKPIYTAVNATAARAVFDELAETWGPRYPAIIRLWDNAWAEFTPFLDYDLEIRTVICSTNHRVAERPLSAGGQSPRTLHVRAGRALKRLYLVTRSLDPTGTGRARWVTRWKPALNAFAITFSDRFPAAETY